MKRRDFIKITGSSMFIAPINPVFAARILDYDKWNSFRLTYHVELPTTGKKARLWLPLPDTNDTDFQFTQGSNWNGTATKAQFTTISRSNSPVFFAEWQGNGEREVTVNSIVKTSNHFVDLSRHAVTNKPAPNHINFFLKPTRLIPINGIVHEVANTIVKQSNATTPLEQARAIYNWIIDNVHVQHDEELHGRGEGDIKFMLENNPLSGKDVDINSLFVGLVRAVGIPARNQYGIRIHESKLHPSLSRVSDVTQSQHCRAEFYLNNIGWVPVNPADMCKVAELENLPRSHPKIAALRKEFFGSWEMNWITFNHLEDVQLSQNSAAGKLPFFLFPHVEIDGKTLDNHNPNEFTYKITSSQLVGTGAKL